MPSLTQNLALVRQRLNDPSPQQPSDAHLLNIMLEKIADHTAELQNTRNHWSVGNWTFQAESGVEDYIVTAADFGRPFLIYTTDDSDTYHSRREVPFSFLQDASQRYSGPQQSYSTDHSAAAVTFYRLSPTTPAWYARLTPIPGASATYQVWYEANYDTSAASLGDAPGLSAFHHLIRVQTALSALPLCAWGDITIRENPQAWRMQAEALRDGLMLDAAKYQRQFDSYKAQSSRDAVNAKLGYGVAYENGDDYGVGSMVSGWGF